MVNRLINYLKYSGASITLAVNPCHWSWIPVFRIEQDLAWESETLYVSILFLTVRIWIDDGSW